MRSVARLWTVAGLAMALGLVAGAEPPPVVRILAEYQPEAEPEQLSPAVEEMKALAERKDTEDLLYTGRVVVDQSPAMLEPMAHIAPFVGSFLEVAKEAPKVEFGVIPATPRFFPEPVDDHHRAMWANWGQSAYYPGNGKFYTSIGDNGSYNARLHIVEYDPATLTITMSPEINDVLNRPDHTFREGKIHGHLDFVGDSPELWFCTYWSKYPEPKEEDWATGYDGGHVMSYNVETGAFTDYGLPMPRASWPSHRVDPARRIMYAAGYYMEFLAWDMSARRPVYAGHLPEGMLWSNRVMLIDDQTGMLYSSNRHPGDLDKRLIQYNPDTNRFTLTDAAMPPNAALDGADSEAGKVTEMRACTWERGPDGLFYGVTSSGELFTFNPDTLAIDDKGLCWPGEERYTTSLQRSPDGRYIYYVPGAHGQGNFDGSPVMQYDTKTGARKVLAFIAPYYEKKYGITLSGAFSCRLDEKGERLFICWNGGYFDLEDIPEGQTPSLFMHNAVMLLHIPESERGL